MKKERLKLADGKMERELFGLSKLTWNTSSSFRWKETKYSSISSIRIKTKTIITITVSLITRIIIV